MESLEVEVEQAEEMVREGERQVRLAQRGVATHPEVLQLLEELGRLEGLKVEVSGKVAGVEDSLREKKRELERVVLAHGRWAS